MNACIFIICWIISGLLTVPLMIILRKKFKRERTLCWLEEISTCIKYGPLLSVGILFCSIRFSEEEKIKRRELKRLEILSIEAEKLRIKSRFEILDL